MASIQVQLLDIMTVKVFCFLNNQVGINVYYYQCSALLTPGATYDQVATYMDLTYGPLYRPLIASAATYNLVHVQRVYPLPPTVYSEASANSGVGSGGSSALATQTCGMLTIRTLSAGRKYRGRKYIPFPGSNALATTGLPIAGYVANLNALATAVEATAVVAGTGGGSVTLSPVLYHRATPASPTPINEANAVYKWGTQRRRGSYGQPNVIPT